MEIYDCALGPRNRPFGTDMLGEFFVEDVKLYQESLGWGDMMLFFVGGEGVSWGFEYWDQNHIVEIWRTSLGVGKK